MPVLQLGRAELLVVVCALSLAVLIAMLFTGPLAGYLVRRRDARTAPPAPVPPTAPVPSPEPATTAAPTITREPSAMPRIARLKEDSTTVIEAPQTLRILRREPTSDTTTRISTPPKDEQPGT